MNLKDNRITVTELLRNPQANKILQQEFPEIMGSPLIAFAGKMSLQEVLQFAQTSIPQETIQRVLAELRQA